MCAAITSRRGGTSSIGIKLPSFSMQRRNRVPSEAPKKRKRPPVRGPFSYISKTGIEPELGHHLLLGQWNNGHRTSGRPIVSCCHGCNSRYLARRHRYWHAARGMPRSFANQLHAATHVELREQR